MPEAERLPENEQLAEGWSFLESNCKNFEDSFSAKGIIFRYTSKPGGLYLFYNPSISFYNARASARALLRGNWENIQWGSQHICT